MKKIFFKNKNAQVKVAKLKDTSLEGGIVLLIAILLITNLLISIEVLFG